jgi:hypothetical protein
MLDSNKIRAYVASELKPFADISKSLQLLIAHQHFDMLAEVIYHVYQTETQYDRTRSLVVKEHLKVIVPCMVNEIWGGAKERFEAKAATQTARIPSRKSPSPERLRASFEKERESPARQNRGSPVRLDRTSPVRHSIGSPIRLDRTSPVRQSRGSPTKLDRTSPLRQTSRGYQDHSNLDSPARLRRDATEPSLSRTLTGLSYQEANSLSDFCNIQGSVTFTRTKRPLTKGKEGSPGPGAYKGDKLDLQRNSPRVVIPRGEKKELFQSPYSPGPAAYYVMRRFLAKHN